MTTPTNKPLDKSTKVDDGGAAGGKSKFEYILLALHLNVSDLPLEAAQLEHLWPIFESLKEAHHTEQSRLIDRLVEALPEKIDYRGNGSEWNDCLDKVTDILLNIKKEVGNG